MRTLASRSDEIFDPATTDIVDLMQDDWKGFMTLLAYYEM
jgi:hypothetical protein